MLSHGSGCYRKDSSISKYRLPVDHWSSISMSKAPIKRITVSRSKKMRMIRSRRLIFSLRHSTALVTPSRRRYFPATAVRPLEHQSPVQVSPWPWKLFSQISLRFGLGMTCTTNIQCIHHSQQARVQLLSNEERNNVSKRYDPIEYRQRRGSAA